MLCFGLLMRLFCSVCSMFMSAVSATVPFFLLLRSDPNLSEGGEEANLAVMVD